MKRISLTKGQFALVDDNDFEELNKHKWRASFNKGVNSFYVIRTIINSKGTETTEFMHRFLTRVSCGFHIDHINHNTLDNRKQNLRIVTHSQNAMNRRIRCDNKSGVTGVNWHKRDCVWIATININKKLKYLGGFKNKKDAIKSRKNAEIKHYDEYAYNATRDL